MKIWIVESWGKWMNDEDAPMIEKVFDSKEKALKYIDEQEGKKALTEIGHLKSFIYYEFEVE